MSQEPQPVHVVAISGSLRDGSYTRAALEIALRGTEELGATTQLIDLKEYNLVFCNGDEASYPDDVFRLREDVKKAQGIILGTPVYHGEFSGVLKNAIDLMGFEQFESRILGLVGVAGGRMGATPALNGLRNIGRHLHAWVVPEEVSIPSAYNLFDKAGNVTDDEIEKRLLEMGRQVARFSYLHTSKQAQEFMKLWETGVQNPGGGSAN
jgi:FMN reductase